MDNYRELEHKFKNEIAYHLHLALPNIVFKKSDLKVSNDYQDTKLSFDMILISSIGVSVRIRKHKYISYKDMTIRYRSTGGQYCEFNKIQDGLADIYFYAYMNNTETDLVKIRICDVDAIRKLINLNKFSIFKNFDGSELATFKFKDIALHGGAIYKYTNLN